MPPVLKKFKKGEWQPAHSCGWYLADLTEEEILRRFMPYNPGTRLLWETTYRNEKFLLDEPAWVFFWSEENPEWGEECP